MLGIKFLFGGVVTGVVRGMGMGYVSEKRGIKNDCGMGMVLSGFFWIGMILIRFLKSWSDLYDMLFGKVLGVG